jgi:predicted nucleic-acid-binding protein
VSIGVMQAAMATRVIEDLTQQAPGYVSVVVVVELVWVLTACYDLTRAQVVQALEALLQSRQLMIEGAEHAARACRWYAASKADFADVLIERMASAAGCSRTMTFDVGAGQHSGMTLIAYSLCLCLFLWR